MRIGKNETFISLWRGPALRIRRRNSGTSAGESAAGADLKKTYDRLLKQIDRIPSTTIILTRLFPTIPTWTPWLHTGKAPCCAFAIQSRICGRGESALRLPFDDFKPEHAKWLIDKKKQRKRSGTAYWNSVLDK